MSNKVRIFYIGLRQVNGPSRSGASSLTKRCPSHLPWDVFIDQCPYQYFASCIFNLSSTSHLTSPHLFLNGDLRNERRLSMGSSLLVGTGTSADIVPSSCHCIAPQQRDTCSERECRQARKRRTWMHACNRTTSCTAQQRARQRGTTEGESYGAIEAPRRDGINRGAGASAERPAKQAEQVAKNITQFIIQILGEKKELTRVMPDQFYYYTM